MNLEQFGEYGKVISHGILEPTNSIGISYHISLRDGSFVTIKRNFSDRFRFYQYKVIDGRYKLVSDGVVADTKLKKFLDTIL
jgi:hypothetical protein